MKNGKSYPIFAIFAILLSQIHSLYATPLPKKDARNLVAPKTDWEKVEISPSTLPAGYTIFSSYMKGEKDKEMSGKDNLSWEVVLPPLKISSLPKKRNKRSKTFSLPLLAKSIAIAYTRVEEENGNMISFGEDLYKSTFKEITEADREKALVVKTSTCKNATATKIDNALKNSLEFKVLSSLEHGDFDPTLSEETTAATNNSVLIAKAELSPVLQAHEAMNETFDTKDLLKSETNIIESHKEEREILAELTFIPTIIADTSLIHPFDPGLGMDRQNIVETKSIEQDANIKRVVPIAPNTETVVFSTSDVIVKKNLPFSYTKQIQHITATHALPKISKHIHIDKLEDDECSFSMGNSLSLEDEHSKEDFVYVKHDFLDESHIAKVPEQRFHLKALKKHRLLSHTDYISSKEVLHSEQGRLNIPELTLSYEKKHRFETNRYKNIEDSLALTDSISRATFQKQDKWLSGIKEISENYLTEEFSLIPSEKKVRVEIATHPEQETNIRKSDIVLPKGRDKTFLASQQLTHLEAIDEHVEENLEYQAIAVGRLSGDFESTEADFMMEGLPSELEKRTKEIFAISSFDKNGDKNLFEVQRIYVDIKDEEMVEQGIDANLDRDSQNFEHPFKAKIANVAFDEDLSYERALLSDERVFETSHLNPLFAYNAIPKIYTYFPLPTSIRGEELVFESYNLTFEDHIASSFNGALEKIHLPENSRREEKENLLLSSKSKLYGSAEKAGILELKEKAEALNKSLRLTGYRLYNWPSLEELNTQSLPSDFYLDTKIVANQDDTFDFACILKATDTDIVSSLPSHLLYILDLSNSLEQHRFNMFKEAIIQSLGTLDSETKFNIALLHKGEVQMLLNKSAHATKSAQSFVKRKLRKLSQGKKTRLVDIITILEKEKLKSKEDGIHRSCVLLSDGKFAKNVRVDREYLQNLATIDTGNFSVYTATVSDNNNKEMLSLLAKLNHGFSLFTRTHASFARKFSVMVKHIKNPIIHDLKITFPDDPDAMAYVTDALSPTVLASKNFTFFANTKTKTPSRVFIQGRSGDTWINILKELPLDTSRKARYALEKKLANQKTLFSLYSFLESKDEQHLSDAKKHSADYDLLSRL